MSQRNGEQVSGFTLIEVLLALAIGTLLVGGLAGVVGRSLQAHDFARERNELVRQARFAMERMVRAVAHSDRLLLPLVDRPMSTWHENVREQHVPAAAPEPGSLLATAVLAVTLDREADRDDDGFPDADNDRDGRIDEDLDDDITGDSEDGIRGIDDDGDGWVDEGFSDDDDDESGFIDEDPANDTDDDGDANVDEDSGADMNGDGEPGVSGVDDDGDGSVDEGGFFASDNDDEDAQTDEDWLDPVVFRLQAGVLMERTPVPWDESGSGGITGRDFIEQPIAQQVSLLRVERLPQGAGRAVLVDLTLELAGAGDERVRLSTRVRVGGAL